MSTSLFGTDGIRSRVGTHPLTPQALPLLGRAIGLWATEKYSDNVSFLLCSDTRYSADWIKAHLISGLLSCNVKVHDAGVLPTPALFHIIKEMPDTCGIVISASHNPALDNGLKLVDGLLGKLSLQDEARITELFMSAQAQVDFTTLGTAQYFETGYEMYKQKLLTLFTPSFLAGQNIVLDCAHGATYAIAPEVFKAYGAEVIALNTEPDGYNINYKCGAVHPEQLQEAIIKNNAHIGFAFDGDGDRVVVVSRHGVIKDGDDILALLLDHPSYKDQGTLVTTIMANQGFEAFLTNRGLRCVRTPVGDKYVVEELLKNKLLLGGEPSGHIVLNDIVSTGDGILVALRLLETVLNNGNLDLISFAKFPQVLINVPVKKQKNLNETPLKELIQTSKQQLLAGRLVVRYSGTEPIIRVMVEDQDHEHTHFIASSLAQQLAAMLS